jgi:hypothetical protein
MRRGKARRELLVAEPERFHHAVEIILGDHVGIFEQLEYDLARTRMFEVERHGFFVRVEHQERIVHAARQIRPPQHLAGFGRFDFDDLGAHRGELQGAIRHRVDLSEIDDANSFQRQTHCACPSPGEVWDQWLAVRWTVIGMKANAQPQCGS